MYGKAWSSLASGSKPSSHLSPAAQLVLPSEIRNARLGCRYQLVCQIANLSSPLLWLRGGRRVTNTSDGMITVIVRAVTQTDSTL